MNSTGKRIKYKSTAGQSAQHISSYLLFLLSVNCLLHQLIWFVVLQKAILFHLMQLQKKITSRGRLDKESVVGIQFIAAEPPFFFISQSLSITFSVLPWNSSSLPFLEWCVHNKTMLYVKLHWGKKRQYYLSVLSYDVPVDSHLKLHRAFCWHIIL